MHAVQHDAAPAIGFKRVGVVEDEEARGLKGAGAQRLALQARARAIIGKISKCTPEHAAGWIRRRVRVGTNTA